MRWRGEGGDKYRKRGHRVRVNIARITKARHLRRGTGHAPTRSRIAVQRMRQPLCRNGFARGTDPFGGRMATSVSPYGPPWSSCRKPDRAM